MDASSSKDGITYLDEKKGVYRQKLELKSEAYTSLMNKVKETCVDPVFEDRYWRTDKLELIKNAELEERYLQQRAVMCAKGLKDLETREVYIFYGGSARQSDEICREGHRTGLKKRPVLGHTGQGIHFVQHYDILTRYLAFLQFKATAHIVIYKAVLGKAKKVKFCDAKDNEPSEPDKKFDCFVAVKHLEPRMSISNALDSCYVYVYEFDETSAPVRYPRRVLPYALITLERKPCVTLDSPFLAVDSGSSELRWEVKGETRRGFRWNITKKPASRQSLKQKVDQVRIRRSQSKEENQKQLHDSGDCPPVLNRYDNELSSKPNITGDEPPILDKHTKLDSIVREIGTKKERIQQIQEQRNTRERSSSPFRDKITASNSGEQFSVISSLLSNSQPLVSLGNITTEQTTGTDSNTSENSETCISGCSEKDISAKTSDDSLQSEFWRNGEIDLLKTQSGNAYTRTGKHTKTHAFHSVPRYLPSSLKPFINLTRIDSSGTNKGNGKPNPQTSHDLHKSIQTINKNQNTSTVTVQDKLIQSAVQKASLQTRKANDNTSTVAVTDKLTQSAVQTASLQTNKANKNNSTVAVTNKLTQSAVQKVSLQTIKANENTSTVAVKDKLIQSAVQKASQLQSSVSQSTTNGRIRLKITNNGRNKGMISSLIDDNGLLVIEKTINTIPKSSVFSSQLQCSVNSKEKDENTTLQNDVYNYDKSVSSQNSETSQDSDKINTCRTNSNTVSYVNKSESCKGDKHNGEKTRKNKDGLHEGSENDLRKTKVFRESQNNSAKKVIINDLPSNGPVKISTVQTYARKDRRKRSSVECRQSCNITCVDHNTQTKDFHDINSNVINNSPKFSTPGKTCEISSQSQMTRGTLLHALDETIQPNLNFNGIEKNKSYSAVDITERNNYLKQKKPDSAKGNLVSVDLNKRNSENINKVKVTRNQRERAEQNKNTKILVGYTNDFFTETENVPLTEANNTNNEGLTSRICTKKESVSKPASSQGRSKQALNNNRKSFDITVMTKRNILIESGSNSYGDRIAVETHPLSEDENNLYDSSHGSSIVPTNSDKSKMCSSTNLFDSNLVGQREYMAGLELQRTCSSKSIGTVVDRTKLCSKSIQRQEESGTDISDANTDKQVDKSTNLNQQSETKTIREKSLVSSSAESCHSLFAQEDIIIDNVSIKTNSSISEKRELSKTKSDLKYSSGVLSDISIPSLISNSCNTLNLAAQQPFAVHSTAPQGNTLISLTHPENELLTSPQVANEAPNLSNPLPNVSSACGSDGDKLGEVNFERNSNALSSSHCALTTVTSSTSSSKQTYLATAHQTTPTNEISKLTNCHDLNKSDHNQQDTLLSHNSKFPQEGISQSSSIGVGNERISNRFGKADNGCTEVFNNKVKGKGCMHYETEKKDICKRVPLEPEKERTSVSLQNVTYQLNQKAIDSKRNLSSRETSTIPADAQRNGASTYNVRNSLHSGMVKNGATVDSETAKKLQKFLQESLDRAHKQQLLTRDSQKNRSKQRCSEKVKVKSSDNQIFTPLDHNSPKTISAKETVLPFDSNFPTAGSDKITITEQRRTEENTSHQTCMSVQQPQSVSHLPSGQGKPILHRSDSQETVIGGIPDYYLTPPSYSAPAEELGDRHLSSLNNHGTIDESGIQKNKALDSSGSKSLNVETRHSTDSGINISKDVSQIDSSLTWDKDNATDTLYENYITQTAVSKDDNMSPLDLTTKKANNIDPSTLSENRKDHRISFSEKERCAVKVKQSDNNNSIKTGKSVESNVIIKKEAAPSTKETQSEITKTLHQLSEVLQEISKLSESKESKAVEHSRHKQSTCNMISFDNKKHKNKQISDRLTQSKLTTNIKTDSVETFVSVDPNGCQTTKDKCAFEHESKTKQVSRTKISNDTTNINVRETNEQNMKKQRLFENCSLPSTLRQEDISVMQNHYKRRAEAVYIPHTSSINMTCPINTSLNSIKDSDLSKTKQHKRNPKLDNTGTANTMRTEPKKDCTEKGELNDVSKAQNLTLPLNIGIKSTVRLPPEHSSNLTTLGNIEIKTESGANASESDNCNVPTSNNKVVNSDGVHFNNSLITIKTEPIDLEFGQNENLGSENTVPVIHPTRNTISVCSNTNGGAVAGTTAEKTRTESRDENCTEHLSLSSTSHLQPEKSVQRRKLEHQGLVGAGAAEAKSLNFESNLKSDDDSQSRRHENQKYQSKLTDTFGDSEELCQPNNAVLSQTSGSKDAFEQPNILHLKSSNHPADGNNTESLETEGQLNDVQCFKGLNDRTNASLQDNKTGSSHMVYLECKERLLFHEENGADSAELPFVFDGHDEPDITLLELFGNPIVKTLYQKTDAAHVSASENGKQGLSPMKEGSHLEEKVAGPVSCSEDGVECEEDLSLDNEVSNKDKMIVRPLSSNEDGEERKPTISLVEEGSRIKQTIDGVVPSTTSAASDLKPAAMQTRTKSKGVRYRSEEGLLNKGGKFVSGIKSSKTVNETSSCLKKQTPVSLHVPIKPAVQTSDLVIAAKSEPFCSPAEAVSLRIDEFLRIERKKSDSQSSDIKDSHTDPSSVSSNCRSIQIGNTDEPRMKTVERDCNVDRKRSRSISSSSKERERKRTCNSKERTGSSEHTENSKNSNETIKRKGFELIPFSEIVRLKSEGFRLGCNRYGRYVFRSHRIGFNKTHRRKAILNASKASVDYKTKYRLNTQDTRRDPKCKKPTKDKGVADTENMNIKTQTSDKAKKENGGKMFLKENDVLKERVIKSPVAEESSNCKRKSVEPKHSLKVSSQDNYDGFDAFKYKVKPEDNIGLSKHNLRNRFNKGGVGYLNWRRKYPCQNKRGTSSNGRNMLQGKPASATKRVLTESERVAEREKAKKEIAEAVRHFRRTYEGTWEDFIADGKVASYLDKITDKLEVIQSKRNKMTEETETDSGAKKYITKSQRNAYGSRLEQNITDTTKTLYLNDRKGNQPTKSPNFSAPPESLLQEIVKEQFIKKVESVTTQVTKELTERFIEGIGYNTDSEDPLFKTQSVRTDEKKSDFDQPYQQDGIISMRNDNHFYISNRKEFSTEACNTNRGRYNSCSQRFNGNNNCSDLGQHSFIQNDDNEQKMLAKNVSELERRYAPNCGFFHGNLNCAFSGLKREQNKVSINSDNRNMWRSKQTHNRHFANDGQIVSQRFCDKNDRFNGRGRFNKGTLYNNGEIPNIRKGSISSNESDFEHDDGYEVSRRSNSNDSSRKSFDRSFSRRESSIEHRRSRSRSNSVTKNGDRSSSYGHDELYNGSSVNTSNKNRRRSASNISDREDRMHDSEYENHGMVGRNNDCYLKSRTSIEYGLFQEGNASRGNNQGDYSSKDDYHQGKSRRSDSNEKSHKRRSNSKDAYNYHERSRSTSSQPSNIANSKRNNNYNRKRSYDNSDNRHRVSILDHGDRYYNNNNEKNNNKYFIKSYSKYDQNDRDPRKTGSYGMQKRSRSDLNERSHKGYYREHHSAIRSNSDRSSHRRSDEKKSPFYHSGHFKHRFYENNSKGRDNVRGLNKNGSRNSSFHR